MLNPHALHTNLHLAPHSGWQPGAVELVQAQLTTQLASLLVAELVGMPGGPALRSALLHTAARFLTSNARSKSPVVQRVAAARDAAAVDAALEGEVGVLEARCGVY